MNRKIIGIGLILTLVPWTLGYSANQYLKSSVGLQEDEEITEMEIDARDDVADGKSKTPRRKAPDISESAYVKTFIDRSIFDSTKVNQNSEPKADLNPEDGVLSDLEVSLLGTVVAIPPEYSVALIKDNRSNTSAPYGLGDNILNEGHIIGVEQKRVLIQRTNNSIEYIEIGSGDDEKSGSSKTKGGKADEEGGVTKDGPNKYIVDQAVLDQLLENPEQLATQVRVIPHKDDGGDIDGYRLSGIRRNSIFYKLGVKNGDIIHNVNGMPLDSMSSAMDAYNSLGSSKNFSFEITRRRQKQNFEYEVR